jgi:hypothetical protein
VLLWQFWTLKPQRTFGPHWLQAQEKMLRSESKGYLIVGKGLAYVAHFVPRELLFDDSYLLIEDESELVLKLQKENVSAIVVDKSYLNKFWKTWIESGHPPEVSNHSVLSRAIMYDGKAIETQTLHLKELQRLKIETLKPDRGLVWIHLK